MPVSQFPGNRNWGYDIAFPFAVQYSYGGMDGLKKLIDAAHSKGIAVIIDVIYNHLGPEGNYLESYGPYFTDKYKTPWGKALNYDDAYCDGVRNFYLENAAMWLEEFHADGLRLDAVHAIWDFGAVHFMQELKQLAESIEGKTGCQKLLIAEIDLNNTRYIDPKEKGGYDLDGQWMDEFHHALHSLLTGEVNGYYEDFGKFEHLERAFTNTYVYNHVYSPHRKKIFGSPVVENNFDQFVVFAQNHDQIGNRLKGDRLTLTLDNDRLKLAAATVLLSPYVPLLFMGEEYGEKKPFLFFADYGDPDVIEAMRTGRKKEFAYFNFDGNFPDPLSEDSFRQCVLADELPADRELFHFYRTLIGLRKKYPCLHDPRRDSFRLRYTGRSILCYERQDATDCLVVVLNYNSTVETFHNNSGADWHLLFSADSIGIDTIVTPHSSFNLQPFAATIWRSIQ
jgi:maltooligosyltrehalose trehalohydrolase